MMGGMASTAPLTQNLIDVARVLFDAGYTVQTTVQPQRGAHLVWITGPAGMAGFHGTLTVGARSGRVTGATLYPSGEDGPRQDVRGRVYEAVCNVLAVIEFRIPQEQRRIEMGAVLSGRTVPTLAERDAGMMVGT